MKTLSINLSTDVVYVSGTVNGKSYTFTLQEVTGSFSTWTAEVDRATPDVYVCELTAIDNRGNTATLTTTLYYGLQLITDRTESDVERAKELNDRGFGDWTDEEVTEFLNGLKGAYNASDLNRVESAVSYVFGRFAANGYDYPVPQIKNTWQISEFMDSEETKRYLGNIRQLRARITVPIGTPEVAEDMEQFTFGKANDLERILEILDECISKLEQSFVYSGEIFGGEL